MGSCSHSKPIFKHVNFLVIVSVKAIFFYENFKMNLVLLRPAVSLSGGYFQSLRCRSESLKEVRTLYLLCDPCNFKVTVTNKIMKIDFRDFEWF